MNRFLSIFLPMWLLIHGAASCGIEFYTAAVNGPEYKMSRCIAQKYREFRNYVAYAAYPACVFIIRERAKTGH